MARRLRCPKNTASLRQKMRVDRDGADRRAVRLRPTAPLRRLRRKMVVGGAFWKASSAAADTRMEKRTRKYGSALSDALSLTLPHTA